MALTHLPGLYRMPTRVRLVGGERVAAGFPIMVVAQAQMAANRRRSVRRLLAKEVEWYHDMIERTIANRGAGHRDWIEEHYSLAPIHGRGVRVDGEGMGVGAGGGLEWTDDSEARRNALAAWNHLARPAALRAAVLAAPPNAIIELTYATGDLPWGADFYARATPGGEGVPFTAAELGVDGVGTVFYTLTAISRDAITRQCDAELRRRQYDFSTLTEEDADQYADLYASELLNTPYLWPSAFRIHAPAPLAVPPAPAAQHAPARRGGWFPFFLSLFADAPLSFQTWLAHFLQIYTTIHFLRRVVSHHREEGGGGLNTTPWGLGCFRYAVFQSGVLTPRELEMLDQLLLDHYRTCPASSHGVLSLPQLRRLLNLLYQTRTDGLPPLEIHIEYMNDGSDGQAVGAASTSSPLPLARTRRRSWQVRLASQHESEEIPGAATVAQSHQSRQRRRHPRLCGFTPSAPSTRLIRIGCVAGHFFLSVLTNHPLHVPDLMNDGICLYGLRNFMSLTADQRKNLTEIQFYRLLSSSRARGIDRRRLPLSTFELLHYLVKEGSVDRGHYTPITTLAASFLLRHDVAAPPLLHRCYTSSQIQEMTRRMTTQSKRATARTADASRMVHYVVDYEDTSDTHQAYFVSAAEICLSTDVASSPLPLQVWSMYYGSPDFSQHHQRRRQLFEAFLLPKVTGWSQPLSSEAVRWLSDPTLRRFTLTDPEGSDPLRGTHQHIPLTIAYGWSHDQLRRFRHILSQPRDRLTAVELRFLRTSVPQSRLLTIWAHNMTYDFPHLIEDAQLAGGWVVQNGFLFKDSKVISIELFFPAWNTRVYLGDSWRLLGPSMSVARMTSAFGLEAVLGGLHPGKEIFLHDWMRDGSLLRSMETAIPVPSSPDDYVVALKDLKAMVNVRNASPLCLTPFDWDGFLRNAADYVDGSGQMIRLVSYIRRYCEADSRIVACALTVFRRRVFELSTGQLDALTCLSASSLADRLFRLEGCYENVAALNGMLAQYFQPFVIGGRCTPAYGWRSLQTLPNEPIVNLDARSLYPTAFVELCKQYGGLLCGDPEPIDIQLYPTLHHLEVNVSNLAGYFVQCELLDEDLPAPIEYPLGFYPFNPRRDDPQRTGQATTSLRWINDLRKPSSRHGLKCLYFDRIGLDNYLKHQPAYHRSSFSIRSGYMFTQGRNGQIESVMQRVYQARLAAVDPALRETLKLLMNGAYGKLIEHAHAFAAHVFPSFTDSSPFVQRHFETVRTIVPLIGFRRSSAVVVNVARPLAQSFSRPHVAAEVLSMARCVMNNLVTRLPPPFPIPSYPSETRCFPRGIPLYTDTDSIHLYLRDFESHPWLQAALGDQLGQFHHDLDGASVGQRAIYLDKKMYCIELPNGDVHMALKGISRASLALAAHRQLRDSKKIFEGVFIPLFRGDSLTFDLLATDSATAGAEKPCFRVLRNPTGGYALQTLSGLCFTRTIHVRPFSLPLALEETLPPSTPPSSSSVVSSRFSVSSSSTSSRQSRDLKRRCHSASF